MDRVEFVKLFLSYGVCLAKIMNNDILQFLYGFSMNSSTSILDKEINSSTTINKTNIMEVLCDDYGYNIDSCAVSLEKIQEIINALCSDLRQGNNMLTKVSFTLCEEMLTAISNVSFCLETRSFIDFV